MLKSLKIQDEIREYRGDFCLKINSCTIRSCRVLFVSLCSSTLIFKAFLIHVTICHMYELYQFSIAAIADSILLLDLKIPAFVKQGETVKMECIYDLEYDGLYR